MSDILQTKGVTCSQLSSGCGSVRFITSDQGQRNDEHSLLCSAFSSLTPVAIRRDWLKDVCCKKCHFASVVQLENPAHKTLL